METKANKDKINRVLSIYTKLMDGYTVNKAEEAAFYGVNERSIQRDIEDIRDFFDDNADRTGVLNTVEYDRLEKGYRLEHIYRMKFSNSEVLAICKILLDSRAFTKKEMKEMLNKLIECCVPEKNRKLVTDLIKNEEYHYIELQHKKVFIDKLWQLGMAIHDKRYVEVSYQRLKGKETVKRILQPAAIMFSEYYFYLTAFIEDPEVRRDFDNIDDVFPTIYRVDRIKSLTVLDERFKTPYSNRFEEGEFRKRVQFMYGGKLRKIKFEYTGLSIESVLDKLPTARIVSEDDGKYLIQAEVYGDGVDMWIRSQGENIEII